MKLCLFIMTVWQLSASKALLEESEVSENVDNKVIILQTSDKFNIPHHGIFKRVEETLNLTCKVFTQNDSSAFKLLWNIPHGLKNSNYEVAFDNRTNSLNLVVSNLQENNSGDYRCIASDGNVMLNNSVSVTVKNKKNCGGKLFMCPVIGNCILQRYVCDGHRDCKNGEDESENKCGVSPCNGKITCDNRCIPISWCCHPYNDVNCSVKIRPNCCHQINIPFYKYETGYMSDHHFYVETSLLQTMYTIIGCALVLMLIVTTLVIAICRLYMKRSVVTQFPPESRNVNYASTLITRSPNVLCGNSRFYDMDMYLDRPSPGLMVTYNINNGIQIVGHPIDPPPYSEVMTCPPSEGPPPPYTYESRESLESQALLPKPPYSRFPTSHEAIEGASEWSTDNINVCQVANNESPHQENLSSNSETVAYNESPHQENLSSNSETVAYSESPHQENLISNAETEANVETDHHITIDETSTNNTGVN